MSRVSVVIPTCNRSTWLKDSIESILAQTCKNFEIIVVDDGSKIPVVETLKEYGTKVRIVRHDMSRGVSAARNSGIRAAKCDLIAQLDDDDLWTPDYLEKNIQIFQKYPEIAMVGSSIDEIDGDGNLIKEGTHSGPVGKYTLSDIFHYSWPRPSAVVIRKKCVNEVGGYDESFKGYEDAVLYFRIAAKHPSYFINERLVKYRVHGASASSKELMMGLDGVRAWERFRTFKPADISNKQVDRRISRQHYRVAREYSKQENWKEAFIHMRKALKLWPFVGSYFIKEKDSSFLRIKKITVPFLAYIGLLLTNTPLKPMFQSWMKPQSDSIGGLQ